MSVFRNESLGYSISAALIGGMPWCTQSRGVFASNHIPNPRER